VAPPRAAASTGARSTLPLLAVLARVSLAVASREAAGESPLNGDEAAAQAGPERQAPWILDVESDGARQLAANPSRQRYGQSVPGMVQLPRGKESGVAVSAAERDSGAWLDVGGGR
jgi:hypothetical protein